MKAPEYLYPKGNILSILPISLQNFKENQWDLPHCNDEVSKIDFVPANWIKDLQNALWKGRGHDWKEIQSMMSIQKV